MRSKSKHKLLHFGGLSYSYPLFVLIELFVFIKSELHIFLYAGNLGARFGMLGKVKRLANCRDYFGTLMRAIKYCLLSFTIASNFHILPTFTFPCIISIPCCCTVFIICYLY